MERVGKLLSIVLIFSVFNQNSFNQIIDNTKGMQPINCKSQVDSLTKLYGAKKQIIPSCKLPTLLALSHYPELRDVKIVFVERSIKTTAACIPSWTFLFKRRSHRVYKIYINNNARRIKGAIYKEVPFNAQVGLIGHELGHALDYSHRSVPGIISMGFKYLFIKNRRQVENWTDSITIAHHLGWQLYEFEDYVMNCASVSEAYKNYKRKIYYKPEDLLRLIEKQLTINN